MARSISQLLIGATVAIGFAVVGVTAVGTAVAQSPLEQTTTNRYEPRSPRPTSESGIISSSETFSSVVMIG